MDKTTLRLCYGQGSNWLIGRKWPWRSLFSIWIYCWLK